MLSGAVISRAPVSLRTSKEAAEAESVLGAVVRRRRDIMGEDNNIIKSAISIVLSFQDQYNHAHENLLTWTKLCVPGLFARRGLSIEHGVPSICRHHAVSGGDRLVLEHAIYRICRAF